MANTFKNKGMASIGTSNTTVYTCPSSTTSTIIGMTVANRSGSNITVSVMVYDNSANTTYFIVSGATVPTGGSLVVVGGDQKIVLEASDLVQVNASASSSADAFVSVLEQT
tara:strand:- start:446 stop:778 length:333 start_codon:yes stop_codon:yes gene_type:complete